jgi:hypothetical protein
MNTTNQSRSPVNELHQQIVRFSREISKLINVLLNCIFALTVKGTRQRRNFLFIALLVMGLVFGLFTQAPSEWSRHTSNIMSYFFNPTVDGSFFTNAIPEFSQFILKTYINLNALRYFLLFLLPFLAAWQLASIYLADIFERKVEIASEFIIQVALIGGDKTIRIQEGEITIESEDSPVYIIGGPGSVIVELDSVALFERPDGQPHVIGPTVHGPIVLDGFERFRQAIDLRDHRTESLNLTSRSLDGIPVQAVDVNFLFSVLRGGNQPNPIEHPYSFLNDSVIESLVYSQAASVTPSGPRPADISKSWDGAMTGLIRNSLGNFMNQSNLTAYLASYGMPEVLSARVQADAVLQSAKRVLPQDGLEPSLSVDETPPAFIPRPDIKTLLFGEFTQGFPALAAQRGVELHWVGIGSWKTPNQIVIEQHLDAWQLSMDNQARRNSGTPNLRTQHIIHLIQDVPLTRFAECLKIQRLHRETMFNLLSGYREQFMKLLHLIEKKYENIDDRVFNEILKALRHINQILGWTNTNPDFHWINQRHPSPNPSTQTGAETPTQSERSYSPEEHNLFNNLILKTRNIEIAERLIEHERKLAPNESTIELIRRAIQQWEKDNR